MNHTLHRMYFCFMQDDLWVVHADNVAEARDYLESTYQCVKHAPRIRRGIHVRLETSKIRGLSR